MNRTVNVRRAPGMAWVSLAVAISAWAPAHADDKIALDTKLKPLLLPQVLEWFSDEIAHTSVSFGRYECIRGHFNLKAAITPSDADEKTARMYRDALQTALDSWQRGLGSEIATLELVDDISQANVVVTFQKDVTDPKTGEPVAGYSNWGCDRANNSYHARSKIRTIYTDKIFGEVIDKIFDEVILQRSITHEFGHILGLDDDKHGNINETMGPLDVNHPKLGLFPSKKDIAALKDLFEKAKQAAPVPQ